MNVRSRLAWVRPFLMLLLVVTVPVVLYWFGYVSRSVEAAVRQYNVTVVAVATSLEERLGTLDKVAGEAERRAVAGQPSTENYLRSLVTGSGSAGVPGTRYLEVTEDHRSVLLSVRAKGERTASVSVKLESLVPWDIVEAEFDGLVVLSNTGRLLAQDRRLPSQARGLPIRISRDERPVDLAPLFELNASRDPGKAPQDAQDPAKPPPTSVGTRWRNPADFSRFETITLAGQRYVAFLQPVRVYTGQVGSSNASSSGSTPEPPAAAGRATLDLLVAGLVSEDRMRGQARTLSRQTLARVFAVVTFSVLLIPLLKLRFIGTHERMRYRDVWVMTLALLGITAVVVLLVLDGPATSTARQVLDGGLKQLHDQIKERANAEATAAVGQLRDAMELRGFRAALGPRPSQRGDARSNAGGCPDTTSPSEPVGNLLVGSQQIDYPIVDTIFIATRCGRQTYKWDARTLPTGLTSVAERGYFRDALALPPAGAATSSHERPVGIAREFVVSKTSGQEQMVFALPVGWVGDEIRMGANVPPELRTHVAALASPMRSVQRTVVPSPFEYVLVGRDARVKFRNARGPYLDERFFEQVQGGSVMAPLAADDPARTVEGEFNYRWRQFHMRASDIPELDMTLVTFYDTETARQLTARAFGVAAGVAVLAILSTLAGSLLATFCWGRQSHDWLWPDTEDTARYLVGIAVCGVAIVFLVWIRAALQAGWFALAVTALPGIVMMLCGSPLWFRTRLLWTLGDARSSPTLYKAAFCGFALSMLLALVAVPTALAFDDALRLYVAAYERVAAEQWSRDLYKKAREFEGEFALVDSTGDAGGCTAPSRTCASREHYQRLAAMLIDPSDAMPAGDAGPKAIRSSLHNVNLYRGCASPQFRSLDDRTGTVDQRDCRTALARDAPLPWSFTAFLARPLSLYGEAGLAYSLALSPRGSMAPRPEAPMSGWTWSASVLVWIVAGFALLAILIYTVAVHVLGLGWQNWRPLDVTSRVSAADGARWLLLRPTSASIGQLAGPTTQMVDMRRPDAVASLVPPAAGHTLVVQHVEAALAGDARHDAVLALATGDVAGCLVLCSEIDPLYYVSQRIREAVDVESDWAAPAEDKAGWRKRVDAQRVRRAAWAEALQDFHQVQAPAPRFPDLGNRVPQNLRRLLRAECAFSDPLIEIAERLAQAPDLAGHSEREALGFILDSARPYYRSLWDLCTEGERLLLIQLAEESVVNPKRFDLLRHLHHRGLVLVEPRFQLMNRSFEEFVKSVKSRERVIELEYTPAALGWKRFSTPLYTLAAVVIAILLYTQQDLVAQMLGVATGAAGALNSLRHLGLLASSPSGGTEKKSANV